jgi:hypothetical protein
VTGYGLEGSRSAAEPVFALYARLLGPLLAGYLLLDRTFAYIHIPGTPLYVGEIVLGIGIIASILAIGDLKAPSKDSEKVFIVLTLLCTWGFVLSIPGVVAYGMNAVRDSALWYYSLFAFLTYGALTRSPTLLDRWISRFGRFTPWLLLWLPTIMIIGPALVHLGPFTILASAGDLLLSGKSGDSAIAALLGLGYLWLFPERFGARERIVWSMMALIVIALAGTQNRGGLVAAVVGATVGLAFHSDRRLLVKRTLTIIIIGLGLALLMPDFVYPGKHLRHYTAAQLIENVWSMVDPGPGANSSLNSTETFRTELWSRVLHRQVATGHLVDGLGFGPNLAADVRVFNGRSDSFRSPHNSHLDVLARMGLIGLFFWTAMWTGWYWRMIAGCRRLAERELHTRRKVAVLCLMVTTAIMVSSFFDPQLEGPQIAILLWSIVGIGIAVTGARLGSGDSATAPSRHGARP